MIEDVSGLLSEWGKRGVLSHLSGTVVEGGFISGTFVDFASGTFWVQPARVTGFRAEFGLDARTTHVALARLSPTLRLEDRVSVDGETYPYDVVGVEENPSHQWVQLQRVVRT